MSNPTRGHVERSSHRVTNQRACEFLSFQSPVVCAPTGSFHIAACPPAPQPQARSGQGVGCSDPPSAEAPESELHHPGAAAEGPGGAAEPLETDHAVSQGPVGPDSGHPWEPPHQARKCKRLTRNPQ